MTKEFNQSSLPSSIEHYKIDWSYVLYIASNMSCTSFGICLLRCVSVVFSISTWLEIGPFSTGVEGVGDLRAKHRVKRRYWVRLVHKSSIQDRVPDMQSSVLTVITRRNLTCRSPSLNGWKETHSAPRRSRRHLASPRQVHRPEERILHRSVRETTGRGRWRIDVGSPQRKRGSTQNRPHPF